MSNSDFVHLHVHTEYSLLDGACRVKDLVRKAADFNMPALAMTDHGNMSGAINFYQSAKKEGVKPIIGSEVYVAPGHRSERTRGGTAHLCLYAKDADGYRNLMRLVSTGFLEGFYYKPRVDKELLAQYSKGLICSSACLKGEVAWHLWHDDFNLALKAADEHLQIFGKGNYYLEMMDHGIPQQKKVNEGMLKIAEQLKLPLIATNDVHYLTHEQHRAHEMMLCIQTQTTMADEKRMRMQSDQFYFKSAEEMAVLFSWCPEALANTLEIAEKCNLELDFDTYHLPHFAVPKGKTQPQYLRELCEKAIPKRYQKENKEVRDRLEHELELIDNMGFVSYFLIVWDFINYAQQHDIPVGPGRGSAAGSIVSYLLGITDLDPLHYGLLFERFLNPHRQGMPDIDIDFCYERRPEVIDYVTEKYGGVQNVAQIITFGTMQAKAAIRDVGRAMDIPYVDVDRIAKLIPNELGITINQALDVEPQLKALIEEDATANQLISTAKTLEGLNRHASTHAAGVVISDKPLTENCPLYRTSDGQVSTGYTMDGIASIGLLKMDFLGLRTLTVISEAVKLIKKTRGIDIDINNVSLDDPKTYELLGEAKSFGVFQLESGGMRDLLRKMKPSHFEDIIAVLALYRPGPMGSGMLDDFIKRKKGEIPTIYPHPKIENVLKETYGIILYQEQVMQMAQELAGFEMAQADNLRRAMSKKIASVMQKVREEFVQGCKKTNNIAEHEANQLFDLIDYFSGYGFNKSHSAAYALITFRTAYLKANFPVEFMCALLTSERDNTDKVVEYVKAAERMGIDILPPNVNASFREFSVVDESTIRFGLLAVKNVGSSAIDSIVEQREQGGKFSSIFDFCDRVDTRLNNRKVVESLIGCGAFEDFGCKRSQLMAVLDKALNMGANAQKERTSGQISFFSMDDDAAGFKKETETMPDIKEWPQAQKLAIEKELLGFYVSGHPLERYKAEIKEFTDHSARQLKSASEGQGVKIVGLIKSVKLTMTRKTNERIAIVNVEDMDGEMEAVVFPRAYPDIAPYLKEGTVVIIQGKVQFRENEPKIVVNDLKDINEVYKLIRALHVDMSKASAENLEQLKLKLSRFPGRVPVYLQIDTKDFKSVEILVGKELHVSPSEVLMDEIKELVGESSFSVTL